jgi:hypothetical protein
VVTVVVTNCGYRGNHALWLLWCCVCIIDKVIMGQPQGHIKYFGQHLKDTKSIILAIELFTKIQAEFYIVDPSIYLQYIE